jgi:hypothetical protein
MTEQTAITKDEAVAALKAAAWTYTPGLDDAAPQLLAAVVAVQALCHDSEGNRLTTDATVTVADLETALALAGQLPQERTIVHCRAGGFGADWDLDAALVAVASATGVERRQGLFGPYLLVLRGGGTSHYCFDLPESSEET